MPIGYVASVPTRAAIGKSCDYSRLLRRLSVLPRRMGRWLPILSPSRGRRSTAEAPTDATHVVARRLSLHRPTRGVLSPDARRCIGRSKSPRRPIRGDVSSDTKRLIGRENLHHRLTPSTRQSAGQIRLADFVILTPFLHLHLFSPPCFMV